MNIGSRKQGLFRNSKFSRMKNPFSSKNFWSNLINIIIVFLIGAGVVVPADSGNELLDAFRSMNPFAIGSLLIANFIIPIYKVIRNKSGTWMASLLSTNFWGQVASAVLWVVSFYVPDIPANTATDLVQSFFDRNWNEMISILFINIALPVIHIFVKPNLPAPKN